MIAVINERIGRYIATNVVASDEFKEQVNAVNDRITDPYTVVNKIMASVLK